MRLLYHCACAEGGLAEYARYQAAALAALPEVEVMWHAPDTLAIPAGATALKSLTIPGHRGANKFTRALRFAANTLRPFSELVHEARKSKPDAILLSTWHEYFAPIWAPRLRQLRGEGIRFGAVVHDPVRDYALGPKWWHRLSIRQAYSFLDAVFSHDGGVPETYGCKNQFQTIQVPHGPYRVHDGGKDKASVRRELGIPLEACVVLSFGHVRDGKNLDQMIAALPLLEGVHLVIAGREQSQGQKPVAWYRQMATDLGVAERCHFHTGYIPEDAVWKFFRASDLLSLTYSRDFRSASGVLNVNAQFGLPVLVSAGPSPLLDAVRSYRLGTIIESPDAGLIAAALPHALAVEGDWGRFRAENSWSSNAEKVAGALAEMF